MQTWIAATALMAGSLSAPQNVSHIVGGEEAETCSFPTAGRWSSAAGVVTGYSCAGALIHPRVFVTYFECIGQTVGIRLGENGDDAVSLDPISTIASEACVEVPGSLMWACVLDVPVLDLPLTPPVYGCERDILQAGTDVAIVGFGAVDEVYGTKHWAPAEIEGIGTQTFVIESDDGATSCGNGDLGGPVYVEYPDGSWHLAGLITTTLNCDSQVTVQRFDHFLNAIELAIGTIPNVPAGIDLTPCHDADGNWAPSEDCIGFSMAGPDGTGTNWAGHCFDGALAEPSTTCGAAYGGDDAPAVRIADPLDGTVVPVNETIAIGMVVNFPVEAVGLSIDGNEIGRDALWPYGFDAIEFAEGTYELTATGYGLDGTTLLSESVSIIAGGEPQPSGDSSTGDPDDPPEGSSTTDGGTDTELPDDVATTEVEVPTTAVTDDPSEQTESGCSCRAAPRGGSPMRTLGGLLLLVGASRRRRRKPKALAARTGRSSPAA